MSKMNTRTKKRAIKQIMMTVLCIITFIVCCIITYRVVGRYDVDAVVVSIDKVHNLVVVEDSTGHTWECYADGLVEGQEVTITLFDTYLDDTIDNNKLIDIKPIDVQILEP